MIAVLFVYGLRECRISLSSVETIFASHGSFVGHFHVGSLLSRYKGGVPQWLRVPYIFITISGEIFICALFLQIV